MTPLMIDVYIRIRGAAILAALLHYMEGFMLTIGNILPILCYRLVRTILHANRKENLYVNNRGVSK